MCKGGAGKGRGIRCVWEGGGRGGGGRALSKGEGNGEQREGIGTGGIANQEHQAISYNPTDRNTSYMHTITNRLGSGTDKYVASTPDDKYSTK